MTAIDARLTKLEERAAAMAHRETQDLRIVRVDKVDLEFDIPILVIQPGYLDLLRPKRTPIVIA